jgi:sortase (surface protein transpeptidase)
MNKKAAFIFVLLIALTGCSVEGQPVGVSVADNVPVPTFESQSAPVRSPEPTHLSIPSIDAESSLVKTDLNSDGTLETPPVQAPLQASWYGRFGRPGETGRPMIILGHVDGNRQKGIFYRLKELQNGQSIIVDNVTYKVYEVMQVDKDSFPTERVYSETIVPELRAITCGGIFNRSSGHYEDNWIVFARME